VRPSLFLFLTLALAGAGIAMAANAKPPAGTATIALPIDTATFKPGPGVEAARQYCATCHSPAYVAMQPLLKAAQWTAEVAKMQKVYGAPIPPDAAATIVQYLTAEYGLP
jgi:mono/diheme cytochrome c family protein